MPPLAARPGSAAAQSPLGEQCQLAVGAWGAGPVVGSRGGRARC